MSWVKSLRAALLAVGFSAFAACGLTDNSGGDSNTHWLKSCDEDEDCGELSCLCGVCSEPCTENDECERFGSQASCGEAAGCSAPASTLCIRDAAGSSGSGGGPGSDDPCRALDARTGTPECSDALEGLGINIIGYTWNGQQCERVYCTCQGTECDRLYPSAEACDRAHTGCFAERGVTRQCETHADCTLENRSCCPNCHVDSADLTMGIRADSTTLAAAGACLRDPQPICGPCNRPLNPAIYPVCIDGECGVLDVIAEAMCTSDEDCQVSTRDCCACNGDLGPSGAIGVDQSFTSPPYCDNPSCDDCEPPPPDAVVTCNLDLQIWPPFHSGFCTLAFP